VRSRSAIRQGLKTQAWPLVASLVAAFQRHPVPMLARQAAYSLLYALPALIALLLALSSFVDRYTNAGLSRAILREIEERAPEEFQEAVTAIVESVMADQDGTTVALGALIALAVALWGGAGGTIALIYACNQVFDLTDTRSWLTRKLLALALTFAGGAMVIVALLLVLLGDRISGAIAERWEWSPAVLGTLLGSAAVPALLVFGAVGLLYWLAPDVPHAFRWMLPGALLATVATTITFVGFEALVRLLDPGSAFGAAGSVLVLLWLLDLVSLFVVSGAVVNAVLSERYDRRLIAFVNDHPERRVPPQASRAADHIDHEI